MHDIERVTGRKARVSRGNRLPVSDFSFFFLISPLSGRGKQTTSIRFFFPSLYKIKRRFLLKFCVDMMTTGPSELNFSQILI